MHASILGRDSKETERARIDTVQTRRIGWIKPVHNREDRGRFSGPGLFGCAKTVQRLERAGVESPARRVDELISRPVVSVSRTQLVRDAVDLMRRRGYSQLPVFEGGRSVGSISEKTILDRAARGESLESVLGLKDREIMDSPFPVVN